MFTPAPSLLQGLCHMSLSRIYQRLFNQLNKHPRTFKITGKDSKRVDNVDNVHIAISKQWPA